MAKPFALFWVVWVRAYCMEKCRVCENIIDYYPCIQILALMPNGARS